LISGVAGPLLAVRIDIGIAKPRLGSGVGR